MNRPDRSAAARPAPRRPGQLSRYALEKGARLAQQAARGGRVLTPESLAWLAIVGRRP